MRTYRSTSGAASPSGISPPEAFLGRTLRTAVDAMLHIEQDDATSRRRSTLITDPCLESSTQVTRLLRGTLAERRDNVLYELTEFTAYGYAADSSHKSHPATEP
ncbi:hypothetical protein PHET_08312 [Paragonimus heterotremus]|uniref:Uncharacterized protein n=1 Tax=Paragonimus heterotremus TaxID=100268 RepID=A0A8J4TBF6_9TREM|nr:hypothetical protein PHET_08312 [Paragonimus heterotremus]